MNYAGKKVAVIGLAVSNTPLIRYLIQQNAQVSVFDKKTAQDLEGYLSQLATLPLELHLGEDYLSYLTGYEYIFLTPGIKKDLPELKKARNNGAIFSSEMEIFLQNCPGFIFGITGSSGKTTTTTLTNLMISSHYPETFVGGNIGRSLIDELPKMNTAAKVVLELSSFQLQELKQSPNLAVITNITPNHLDIHASMEEYILAKSNILSYQSLSDLAILNYDQEVTRKLNELVKGRLYYFSRNNKLDEGAFLDGERLIIKINGETEVLTTREKLKLLGDHNVDNILVAALIGRLAGVPLENLREIAESFTGVEHRLELVRELNGVLYYNDSISTTPDRAIAGLRAMTKPTILIAGGYDKKLPFDEFAAVVVKSCRHLVVLGVTAAQIIQAVQAVQPDFSITQVASLQEAVATAKSLAKDEEVVLLSPACASYDMFKDYQERGKLFKELVRAL